MRIYGVLLTILLSSCMSFASTWYVSPDGTGTSQSPDNPGNLSETLEDHQGGDTIYLRGGEYTELLDTFCTSQTFLREGNENNPTRLTAYNNEEPVLTFGKIYSDWQYDPNSNLWYRDFTGSGLDFDSMRGIKKYHDNPEDPNAGINDGYGVTVLMNTAVGWQIYGDIEYLDDFLDFLSNPLKYFSSNPSLTNEEILEYDFMFVCKETSTVYLHLGSGTPDDIYIADAYSRIRVLHPYIEINGLTLQYAYSGTGIGYFSIPDPDDAKDDWDTGRNCNIINNTIRYISDMGIYSALYTDDLKISENTFYNTGQPFKFRANAGYDPNNPNSVLFYCYINNLHHSLYISGTDGATIDHNVMYNSCGQSCHPWNSDSYPKNIKIFSNYIDGGFVGSGTNNMVFNNIILAKDSGSWGVNVYPSTGYQIYNNLIDAANGIIVGSVGSVSHVTIKNNIILTAANGLCVYLKNLVDSPDIDYNLYYGGTYFWADGSLRSFSNYQGYMLSQYDSEGNSQYGDPCFVDYEVGDYHLLSNSPCIDAGDPNIPSDPNQYNPYDPNETDYDGMARVYDGNWDANDVVDIGPYEYQPLVWNLTTDEKYSAIQSAINAAQNGDEIVVYPGTYEECVDLSYKAVILRSADPNDWDIVNATIIHADTGPTVAIWHPSQSGYATLKGFTVTNTGEEIAAIRIFDGFAVVSHCVVRSSYDGIGCDGSWPLITNCIIENSFEGIYCTWASATIANCIIRNNDCGIFLFRDLGSVVKNCTIVSNTGDGIYSFFSVAPTVINSILWNSGDDLYNCSATYSCIEDNDSGTGNIHNDPCFVDPDNDDYHLESDSPCINAGDPNGDYDGQVDIDNQDRVMNDRVDIGADECKYFLYHWEFDEGSGTKTCEAINNLEGTIYGAQWTSRPIDPNLSSPALSFDGTNDYVDLNNALDTASSSLTISYWIKTENYTKDTYLGNMRWNGLSGYVVQPNRNILYLGNGSARQSYDFADLVNNTWTMITFVVDTTTVKFYRNGSYVSSLTKTLSGNIGTGPNAFKVGRDSMYGCYYFQGAIDELRIYKRALTQTEISDLYSN